jgi:hypothetical protein
MVPEAIQLLVSALLGAAAGAFAAAYKSRKELESLYDIELRRRRIYTYSELWKLLEPLADWSPPGPVTYGSMSRLSNALRSWYFGSGGLFLSPKTRAPYFNLQQALSEVSKDRSADDETVLDEDTHEIVKALASRLRTASTDDVATRVEPRLAGPFGSRIRWPWAAGGPPVRVLVDRRWDFDRDPPEAAFYVVVENTTDDELEVKDIMLVEEHAKEKSFLLQPAEAREVKVPIRDRGARPGHIPPVTVTLADGRIVSSSASPDVAILTPVLERPRRGGAASGEE